MKELKWGGIAAIMLTLIYTVGIVMQSTMLDMSHLTSAQAQFEFVAQRLGLMVLWISLLYVVFGLLLMVMTTSISEMFKVHHPWAARLIFGLGTIWSTLVIASGMIYNTGLMTAVKTGSVELFATIQTIHQAIGGNNEVVGALWMLVIVYVGFRKHLFPKFINLIGYIAGAAGVLTMVPRFYEAVIMIFALGQMIWWIGMGISMIKRKTVMDTNVEFGN